MQMVILVEEPSMRETLKNLLQKLDVSEDRFTIITHRGVSDMLKSLPRKLRAWKQPGAHFLILRDNDNGNCKERKTELEKICAKAGKLEVSTIRIVCQELEAFFLGDLEAVQKSGLTTRKVEHLQRKEKFRTPDNIVKPSKELTKLIPEYQKVSGAQAISPHLSIDKNKSTSFLVLVQTLTSFAAKQ